MFYFCGGTALPCVTWHCSAAWGARKAASAALPGCSGHSPLPGSSSEGCDLGKEGPEQHSRLEYTTQVVYGSSCVLNMHAEPEKLNLNT